MTRAIAEGAFEWRHNLPATGLHRLAIVVADYAKDPWRPLDEAVSAFIERTSGHQVGTDLAYAIKHTGFAFDVKLDILEALGLALKTSESAEGVEKLSTYIAAVDDILVAYGCDVRMIEGRIVPFDSPEMLDSTVRPALVALANDRYANADKAYREALSELRHGKPANAVTDVGTALQEMLTARGADGNVLGKLIRSARDKGLLAPNDSPLLESITKACEWAATQRNDGEVHRADPGTTMGDAWLMVHIVGALIVRLAEGDKRGE